MEYIHQFNISGLWGRLDLAWENINEDVNVLVGINGCGKTTLLNVMYDYYKGNKMPKNLNIKSADGNKIDSPVSIVRSFDVPPKTKKKSESNLLNDLNYVIQQNGEGTSFFDYRMRMINYKEETERIEKRIDTFFNLVNSLFSETDKYINIDKNNNRLVFNIKNTEKYLTDNRGIRFTDAVGNKLVTNEDKIQLEQLSSGEKQMLLILTTVFLQDEKPFVLFLDEPEISLHISWQYKLIAAIRQLNPHCQIILTTHSPGIFAEGWQDKIVFMEDLIKKL